MKSNDSSKLSIKAESETHDVKKKTKKQVVVDLVKEWQHNFDVQKKNQHYCYELFVQKYSKISGLRIEFDNSISNTLIQISKEIDFLQFNDQKDNQLKMTLQFINQILKQKHFISERQYNKFKSTWFSSTLQDSIYLLEDNLRNQGYLRKKFESENVKKIEYKNLTTEDKKILAYLWEICIIVSIDTFWLYILKQKIQHRQLVVIFKVYDELMKQKQTLRLLRNQVAHYIKEWIQRKRLQKLQPIRKIETSIVEYDHFLDMRAQEISVYLNKDRLEKYTQQYNQLTEYLTKRCSQKIRFQPYGSYKSKFLIVKYSDIDVGLYFQSEKLKKRQNVVQVLDKINDAINADRSVIPNCLYSKAFKAQMIKVPFVKVIYNNGRGRNLQVVSTMDVIINNYEGIENSNLLALYADDEYLLKYCNLIKYWAVSRNLINLERKMEGLSSYGIILMCLYYLMVTKQIPYLRKINGQYQIGRDNFNISLNFLDNFIGFLQFYSYEYIDQETNTLRYGRFQKEKMIVCLMEEHDGKKVYDNGIIINMYDFIDGSNPGRMRTHLQGKFNSIFQETLKCLYQRSISFLEIVYNYNQSNNKSYQNKIARRGNRIAN